MRQPSKEFSVYIRNFIFGVEDSLVSTVGLLAGIAAAGVERASILLTGAVLIFVEAFSMAVGSFLSESSTQEYLARREGAPLKNSLAGGLIMFFSYFASGFIPLLPYIVFDIKRAFWVSIIFSLAALFFLGVAGAKISGINILKSGLKMLIIGGFAVAVGVIVGQVLDRNI